MQVKTVTVFAASLALAQASKFDLNRRNDTVAYWGDENVKPTTTTKPTSPEETTTTHWSDVDIKTTTTTKPVSPETSSTTTWGDWTSSTTSSKPVSPETSTSSYVYWGDENVDPTSSSTTTWADWTSSTTSSKPVSPETSSTTHWGDWETTTTSSKPVSPETSSTHVYWGDVKPTPKPEEPVSPEVPVDGGKGDHCAVVTETVTKAVTVTVKPGKPGKPTDAPPAPSTQWQEAPAPSSAPEPEKPSAPQTGYMGVVSEWRGKMGMSDLTHSSQLESNALDCSASSGGNLVHKLNPGSMAQVMAPGNSGEFESVFVGGWLCERSNLPGLSGVCGEMAQGWNHAGQTGHADILTSDKYSKIGCGCASDMWTCDLA